MRFRWNHKKQPSEMEIVGGDNTVYFSGSFEAAQAFYNANRPVKIERETVFKKYMDKVNKICDDLEDKTSFSPEECVELVCQVLEENPELIKE